MSNAFIKKPQNSNLLVVDGLNLAFRWKHSGAKDFREDYVNTIRSLARSYLSSNIIVTADMGTSSYRKGIYPEYKQNRKDKFAEQTEAEKKAFEEFFSEYSATLDSLEEEEIPLLRFPGVEADDIAAYITARKEYYNISDIWLVSSDKDWDLLVREGVSRFSYVTRKETSMYNWAERYECTQEEYISIKCLMGDTGDNIKGIPGIGPKKALALVQQYGSAMDVAASLPIQSKYKYIQALNEFGADNILLNYRLMDLVSFCHEAIGDDNLQTIDNLLKEIYGNK